jgi:tetratricopeptide (TPR) repeat protein
MKRLLSFSLILVLSLRAALADGEGPSRRERLRWAAEAQERFAEKKYDEAARWLEKAAAPGAAPHDLANWWPVLGRCYEATGNYQKALASYRQAQELRPNSLDRVLDLARVYARVELDAQAIGLYERALKMDRQRKDVMLALAELYVRQRRWEDARDLTDRYLRLEPQDTAAQELMARAEEELGDLTGAARRWEALLAVRPSAAGYFYAGRLWARQDQFDLAERAFETAASRGLADPAFFIERGLLAWRRGRNDDAVRYWKKALEADPKLPVAKFLLALGDAGAGRKAEAAQKMRALAAEEGEGYVKDLARSYLAANEGQ